MAFIISILVIHVSNERISGSKCLQLLSGTHFTTYWLSNYIFDLAICFLNIFSMLFVIKLVDFVKNDQTSEISPIASDDTFGYVWLLFLVSSFSWCALGSKHMLYYLNNITSYLNLKNFSVSLHKFTIVQNRYNKFYNTFHCIKCCQLFGYDMVFR